MDRSDGSFAAFAAAEGPRLRATAFLLSGDRWNATTLTTAALATTHRQWRRLDPTAAGPAARAALVRLVVEGTGAGTLQHVPATDVDGVEVVGSGRDDTDLDLVRADLDDADLDDADRAWLAGLAGLPVRARIALVLRLHDGLEPEDVARLLETDERTVAGLLHAALQDVAPLLDHPAASDVGTDPPAAVAPQGPAPDDTGDPDDDPYAIYRRPR